MWLRVLLPGKNIPNYTDNDYFFWIFHYQISQYKSQSTLFMSKFRVGYVCPRSVYTQLHLIYSLKPSKLCKDSLCPRVTTGQHRVIKVLKNYWRVCIMISPFKKSQYKNDSLLTLKIINYHFLWNYLFNIYLKYTFLVFSVTMDRFMSDLLARAACKSTDDLTFLPTSDHIGGMIADEPTRRENSSVLEEEMSADSSLSSTGDETSINTRDINSATDLDYPSYVSLFGSDGYSSPPTYIRGDYYSLSPPLSTEPCNNADYSQVSARRLSFSIESILGRDVSNSQESNVCNDTPAKEISSSCYSEDSFVYQLNDSSPDSSGQIQISADQGCEQISTLFWCHVCEDFCENRVDACMHQNNHFNNKDHCRLRRTIFRQTGYITSHEKTDYFNKLKCGQCERIVTYRFFKVHLKSHDGHVCEMCDKEFQTSCRLRDHMNSHYGYKPYVCKICSEQFSDRRDLHVHSRKHKPCIYQCNFCQKSFRTRHAQTVHERTHTGRSPFVCFFPGCQKSFSQSVLLQLHLKAHKNNGLFQYQ